MQKCQDSSLHGLGTHMSFPSKDSKHDSTYCFPENQTTLSHQKALKRFHLESNDTFYY